MSLRARLRRVGARGLKLQALFAIVAAAVAALLVLLFMLASVTEISTRYPLSGLLILVWVALAVVAIAALYAYALHTFRRAEKAVDSVVAKAELAEQRRAEALAGGSPGQVSLPAVEASGELSVTAEAGALSQASRKQTS